MSDKLYEIIGRKQERLEELDGNYTALLNLLGGVVSGGIDPSRLLVNLSDRTWVLMPEGRRPPLPATINGLPVRIVAPSNVMSADEIAAKLAERNGSPANGAPIKN